MLKRWDMNLNKNILVSIPRSGYNFIRYCIEYLTEKRTPGSKSRLIKKGDLLFNHSHHYNKDETSINKLIVL